MRITMAPCAAAALTAVLAAAAAFAQSGQMLPSADANGIQPVAYDSPNSCTADSCRPGETTCGDTACGGCASKCGGGCGCCNHDDPWTLFNEGPCGLTIGGWLSGGIFSNAYGAKDNGPLGFNDVGNAFTFNEFWLFAEKVADTGGCGTDWGFRMDYIFGADGPDTQAFGGLGWDTRWITSDDGVYGSAMPQLYGEVAINNLSVKFGHFFTIIGWEVVPAPDNFFYTHAYTMYYGEPFTHTGALATYDVGGDVKVYGGWTMGWDTGFDNTPEADTFLGGVSVPLGEKISAIWACSAGNLGVDVGDVYMNSICVEVGLTDKLTYILQHDLGTISHQAGTEAQWYGINQYLQYALNDCWALGARIEWFRDNNGARVIEGNAGNYYELTGGLNYKPCANLIVRPEVRYDWYDGTIGPEGAPFDNGTHTDQFSGGFDVIFTY